MENEEAWIAPYYAGDYLTMADENENLQFYLPERFNLFTDAMCIPKCCENKEEAELFINFLCRPDIAGGNMDWICYSTPIEAAKEHMDPEMVNDNPISYPSDEVLQGAIARKDTYLPLDRETTRYMDSLFMKVRNGISLEGNTINTPLLWGIGIGAAALLSAAAILLLRKKRKN
jgi:spermidine/putrescine transport system substrate-binding protein